jgi:hypothetical protein
MLHTVVKTNAFPELARGDGWNPFHAGDPPLYPSKNLLIT